MILQALIQGGWNNAAEEKEESFKSEELSDEATSDKDNGMSTLDSGKKQAETKNKDKDEQEMVQSALNSQNVSRGSPFFAHHLRVLVKFDFMLFQTTWLLERVDQFINLFFDLYAQATDAKEQLVDTLDQDLDLDNEQSNDSSSASKPTLTTVGLKKSIKEAGKNKEEESKEKEEESKDDTLASTTPTEATKEPEKAKHDYSLLDSLSAFLYEDDEPYPILCGYFLKVMDQLLDKQKQMTLEYLLLHQDGKVFSGLLHHLGHHSLATLLIKLIEQQIQPEKKDKWDASDNSDLDIEAADQNEQELTADQKRMQ